MGHWYPESHYFYLLWLSYPESQNFHIWFPCNVGTPIETNCTKCSSIYSQYSYPAACSIFCSICPIFPIQPACPCTFLSWMPCHSGSEQPPPSAFERHGQWRSWCRWCNGNKHYKHKEKMRLWWCSLAVWTHPCHPNPTIFYISTVQFPDQYGSRGGLTCASDISSIQDFQFISSPRNKPQHIQCEPPCPTPSRRSECNTYFFELMWISPCCHYCSCQHHSWTLCTPSKHKVRRWSPGTVCHVRAA